MSRTRPDLDGLLLASPQLHSLETKLYCDSNLNHNGNSSASKELQSLQRYLTKGNSIKHLPVEFCPSDDTESHRIEERLDFVCEGWYRSPALESFAWIDTLYHGYTPTPLHTWWSCMNWSKLRTLNLGRGKATDLFFKQMTGNLNGLKHLSLFMDTSRPDRLGSEGDGLAIFSAFLRSTEGLEILRLVGPGLSVIIPTILSYHAQTLERLSFRYEGNELPWTRDKCMDVLC